MYDIFIQYIQPESLEIQEGEFVVSRDLLVDLWLKFREYNRELQLRDIMGGDFVVLTEDLWEDLDEFRKIFSFTRLFCS